MAANISGFTVHWKRKDFGHFCKINLKCKLLLITREITHPDLGVGLVPLTIGVYQLSSRGLKMFISALDASGWGSGRG
jgi:hypothetical protein